MAEFNVTINQLTSKADELEQLNATFDSMIKTLQETDSSGLLLTCYLIAVIHT